jgi:hypothetical protein
VAAAAFVRPSVRSFVRAMSLLHRVAWFLSWANGFVVIVIVVDDDSDSEEVVCGLVLCLRLLSTEQCWWMGRARAKRHQSELYRASDLLSAAADEQLARLQGCCRCCVVLACSSAGFSAGLAAAG